MPRERIAAAKPQRFEAPEPAKPKTVESVEVSGPDAVNEMVIIAAAIVDRDCRKKLVAAIHPDSFFAKGNSDVWAAIAALEQQNLEYDPATIKQLSNGKVDVDALERLIARRPEPPPNLWHHVDVLRWEHARVDAINGPVNEFLEALRDNATDPDRVRELAGKVGKSFESGRGPLRYMRDSGKLIAEQMAEIRKRSEGTAIYPYGIDGFDRYTDGPNTGRARMVPGAAPGEMTLITGVSSSGKSTLAVKVAIEQANAKRRVLFGAWEFGAPKTLEAIAAQSLGLDRTSLKIGSLPEADLVRLEEEMHRLTKYIHFFDLPFDRHGGTSKRTNSQSLDALQEYVEAWGAGGGVVFFDLFRYAITETKPDEEDRALTRLKGMNEETKAHFVIVHQQLMKDVERRPDPQPTRDGVKGSSGWFDTMDTVIAVHREFLFKAVPDDCLRLLVLKQRSGIAPLTVDCSWNPDTAQIWNGRTVADHRVGVATEGSPDEIMTEKNNDKWKKPKRKREGER